MTYPFHFQSEALVTATPEELFDRLDDPRRLAGHMSRRRVAMAGASMAIETDAQQGRELGSIIRVHGRVLGIPISLEEIVVERKRPWLKAWVTAGQPRLLVIGQYRMGFRIVPTAEASHLTVFIDYRWPSSPWLRLPARLFASAYARWCCRQMVKDAARPRA
ncbi:MAG TPA: SRPBCC family protein [Ramlibacter sp.]|nr:SRPBCC family protein [Ramlibacter sp.]